MSTENVNPGTGMESDEAVRAMLLLMPRLVGRTKRAPVPESLRPLNLTARHLSLLAYLAFDGPLTVNTLAARLEVAPTTVSFMVGSLGRQGVLERREDPTDRRRAIVSISGTHKEAIDRWLATGAGAWRKAFDPLTPEQRALVIETMRVYEREIPAAEGEEV